MADFGLSFKVTSQFFDTTKVQASLDKAKRRNLSRFGAFVRRTARSSIRRSKKSSQPGKPPRAHSTDKTVSIKNILFAYDPRRESVVIGPVKLNGQQGRVPSTLEKGGKATIHRGGKTKTVHIKARPYMEPAFDENRPKLPQLWRNSVK